MAATIIIGVLVFLYAAFVVRRRIRQLRAGQYCCGCSGCRDTCSCEKKWEEE